MDIELLKWFAAALASAGGALAVWFRRFRALRRRVAFLHGLPDEMKSELIDFEAQGAHTLRLNPTEPTIRWLISRGVLRRGSGGGGTYDAIDAYVSVSPEWTKALTVWLIEDPDAVQELAVRVKHRGQPLP